MERNEIYVLVNDYCDLRYEQEKAIKNVSYNAYYLAIREYNHTICNIEYELYQISKKLYDIDDMYYNISKEKTDRSILLKHYINIENDKKNINIIKYDFFYITNRNKTHYNKIY